MALARYRKAALTGAVDLRGHDPRKALPAADVVLESAAPTGERELYHEIKRRCEASGFAAFTSIVLPHLYEFDLLPRGHRGMTARQ